jgi:hypothetical protein
MTVWVIAGILVASAIGVILMGRAIRFFVRLTILGVILVLLAGLFAWRYWSDSSVGKKDTRPATQRKAPR